jgi:Arc/MetJ family transcription regulator
LELSDEGGGFRQALPFMEVEGILSSMKTTLDIPEEVLAEAMEAAGATTKREAVMRALEAFNRRERLRKLTARLGNSDTFMTPDELTELRSREIPGARKVKTKTR